MTSIRGLSALPLNLPVGSQVYADSAYLDYTVEDDLSASIGTGEEVD